MHYQGVLKPGWILEVGGPYHFLVEESGAQGRGPLDMSGELGSRVTQKLSMVCLLTPVSLSKGFLSLPPLPPGCT